MSSSNSTSLRARHGDCYDRGVVRVEEMRQSLRIIEQCVNNMPEGTYKSLASAGLPAAERTDHARYRNPDHALSGRELGSGDSARRGAGRDRGHQGKQRLLPGQRRQHDSYRTRIRTPSFAHMQMLPRLARGRMIPDLFAILGAMDFVLADVDR